MKMLLFAYPYFRHASSDAVLIKTESRRGNLKASHYEACFIVTLTQLITVFPSIVFLFLFVHGKNYSL